MDAAAHVTIGVAIPVPEPLAARIDGYRESIGDIFVHTMPAHITLIPPISADLGAIDGIAEHLARVAHRHRSFGVRLHGSETFRPVSPVVFIGIDEGVDGCTSLEADVRSGPLAIDLRFPYHPHVTIAFEMTDDVLDAAQADFADYAADFVADRFCLYEQEPSGVWRVRRTFELAVG